ncbi:MAG: glutathione peroxidase, partial [Piscirickettsiaceae bacterium]|nr:glutathione peroxidase [Piscirickettsiaceae bacterium]
MSEFYDFSLNNLQGQPIDFAEFKDKVLLIVNTASQCGFTPQYEG